MRRFSFFWCLVACTLLACNSQTPVQEEIPLQTEGHAYTNQLIHSTSPYLLQHAHNPVNWYPWGEAALKKAQKEDKLLIISVGYAACHWCHVMEHESFEDTAVASLMNKHFVAIKVDREERPDVDQIYMNAAYLTTKRGGWPLNAFALPDGRPFFAATYFPKEQWMRMLNTFIQYKQEKPEELELAATQITQGIRQIDSPNLLASSAAFAPETLDETARTLLSRLDHKKGGLNKAPKFPMPNIHQFLLRYHHLSQNPKALKAVQVSLDQMAMGGIYDHLGGGFARYSTDADWKVPHFEKMLYDNGQLVSLYAEAYQLTREPRYRQVVEETLAFIERELRDDNGGFYSSLDADSEGEEGKFYVWSQAEIETILGDQAAPFLTYYSVEKNGNWEDHNILYQPRPAAEIAEQFGLSPKAFAEQLQAQKAKLLAARSKRIRPGLDDKILTAWNALMLSGYVQAYRVLDEGHYLDIALKNARFIKKNLWREDGGLYRSFKDGQASINAFADDYGLLIEAFVHLYQATFDEQWLFDAEKLMAYCLDHFFDEESGLFFYTSDLDPALITRSKELSDNVIPGANSSLAKGLFLLGSYLYRDDFLEKSEHMLQQMRAQIQEQPAYHANWNMLMSWFTHPPYEVAIVGKNWNKLRRQWDQHYLPNAFLLGGKTEGKLSLLENKLVPGTTTIYVCQNKACKLPVETVEAALPLME